MHADGVDQYYHMVLISKDKRAVLHGSSIKEYRKQRVDIGIQGPLPPYGNFRNNSLGKPFVLTQERRRSTNSSFGSNVYQKIVNVVANRSKSSASRRIIGTHRFSRRQGVRPGAGFLVTVSGRAPVNIICQTYFNLISKVI